MFKAKRKSVFVYIVLIALILLFLFLYIQNKHITKNIMTLEGGWEFAVNGGKADMQPKNEIGSYIFPKISKGIKLH